MDGAKEKEIQKAVLDALWYNKIFAWRNNSGAVKVGKRFFRFGYPGSPDIIAIHPNSGTFIGIEVKTKRGKLSKSQKEFKKNLEKNNGLYIIVRSIDDLMDNLKKII